MNATLKKKLCWNCEGRVAFAEENCPYCGVYLSSSTLINPQTENSIPTAPYSQTSEKSIPAAPYTNESDESEDLMEEEESTLQEKALQPSQGGSILSLTLLLASSLLFVFGLILFVFSHEGTLYLQWNATYWYAYLGAAIVLFIAGWKSLKE